MLTKFIFIKLLKVFAKKTLTREQYWAFEDRLNYYRMRDLKETFSEHWEEFSERYREIKDRLSDDMPPSVVMRKFVPGGIERKPELFRAFEHGWAEIEPDVMTAYYGADYEEDVYGESDGDGGDYEDGGYEFDATDFAAAGTFLPAADPGVLERVLETISDWLPF